MIQLHFFDWTIILGYLTFMIWIGYFKNKSSIFSDNEFILSNRKLGFNSFVATLVTTWYGAILGIGENTYLYGIQTWFIFSFPYYIFAIAYAFFIAPKIRKKGNISIPDHFHKYFGKKSGVLSAILIIILASPAPYILSMGVLLQFFLKVDLGLGLIISTFFSIFYLWKGGFSSVIRTDFFQFICMFLGFFILLGFLWKNFGDPYEMIFNLPKIYLDPLGGNTIQYVFVWFFIAAWTFVDPGFFQRAAAAKTPKIAKNGILTAILFWAIFDTLTIFCGLYAINLLKTDQSLLTYPLLAIEFLPIGFLGLFLIGLFAIIMSTIDSLSFISAITFGRDIIWRIRFKNKKDVIMLIRIGLIIISVISLIIAYFIPSVIKILFTIGSIIIPSIILPFIISLIKSNMRIPELYSIQWILFPLLISFTWLIFSNSNSTFFNIEPFYPGMVTSILYYMIIIKGKLWQLK